MIEFLCPLTRSPLTKTVDGNLQRFFIFFSTTFLKKGADVRFHPDQAFRPACHPPPPSSVENGAVPAGRRPAGADPAGQGPGIAPKPWIIAEPSPGVCRRENSSATGTEAF